MKHSENRFIQMATCYHAMAPHAVPQYDWLQSNAVDALHCMEPNQHLLLDLGGGSGRMTKKLLSQFPHAKAIIVDSSEAFLNVARKYLEKEAKRVEFIHAEIESDWETQVSDAPTAIVSMSCIHHLTSEEKRRVYHKAADILAPGGILLNVDEMRAPDTCVYLSDLHYWWNFVTNVRDKIEHSQKELFDQFFLHFQNWKIRNIDHFAQPKQKGDDLHDTPELQLSMFREAGLESVASPFHFRLWYAVVGRKSPTNQL